MTARTKYRVVPAVVTAMLLLPACDTLQTEKDVDEEDLQLVTAIIAGALSDRNEGFMSDVYDLTAELNPDGMRYGMQASGAGGGQMTPPWRGGTRNFRVTYDPATGTHTLEYERSIEMAVGSNLMQARLQYIYRDVEGRFLEFPRRQRDDIASIEFEGFRKGSLFRRQVTGDYSIETEFERSTTWFLDGLDEAAASMALGGEQHHEGSHRMTGEGREMQREFSLHFKTVDVTIEKPLENTGPLESRVSGTIEYAIHLKHTRNGDERTQSHTGTIELTGDGGALLAFSGLRQVFRIKLAEGDVQRTR